MNQRNRETTNRIEVDVSVIGDANAIYDFIKEAANKFAVVGFQVHAPKEASLTKLERFNIKDVFKHD